MSPPLLMLMKRYGFKKENEFKEEEKTIGFIDMAGMICPFRKNHRFRDAFTSFASCTFFFWKIRWFPMYHTIHVETCCKSYELNTMPIRVLILTDRIFVFLKISSSHSRDIMRYHFIDADYLFIFPSCQWIFFSDLLDAYFSISFRKIQRYFA